MRERVRRVATAGLGGLFSGAAKAPAHDPATMGMSALGDAASEVIQALVDEAATNGIAPTDQATLDEFGQYIEAHAQLVPESEEILKELSMSIGPTTNYALYAHALSRMQARAGAARQAMLSGLARSVYDRSPDQSGQKLRRAMSQVEHLTDDQVSILSLLSDSGGPFSRFAMAVEPADSRLEDYGEHMDEVVLLLRDVLSMIREGYIVQIDEMGEHESPQQYEKRVSDPRLQPQRISEIRMSDLVLSTEGKALARTLGLGYIDNTIKRQLREEIDPNGVVLNELDQGLDEAWYRMALDEPGPDTNLPPSLGS
jgi:hypothetical protein